MTVETTIEAILAAGTWTQRIQQIRLVPQRHGTEDHSAIYAEVARELYMPHLAPDFAYIHESPFYETEHFFAAYDEAARLTAGFTRVAEGDIQATLMQRPRTLLVFRTLLGLTKEEFAHSTLLAGGPEELPALSASQIDTLERSPIDYQRPNTAAALAKATAQAQVAAKTITMAMDGELFGDAPPGLKSKQRKPDTEDGWNSVRDFATNGVPLRVFLHQRHYGGAFRQVLDATSTKRGDLIEDAVEALFAAHGISFIRTGSHNQADIARRFEVHVTPAPDFVVFDPADDSLKAMLECKGTNNGGTARDKALRFRSLKAESVRLGGVPLFAVLGGIGWARINDALGPVVRDTDGRVFTLSTLTSMLEVAPFPSLITRT
ncbi:hypothetical protein [Paraburkholderia ferrariae]|uniref:hypothetical protein n=1 Tax=Paraburkholderia ferrariae TaxID=386056 RepID=UPI0004845484|nr:hypothetical protein [Paraburkholderia ferrariae]